MTGARLAGSRGHFFGAGLGAGFGAAGAAGGGHARGVTQLGAGGGAGLMSAVSAVAPVVRFKPSHAQVMATADVQRAA